jgi:hypothetical protein
MSAGGPACERQAEAPCRSFMTAAIEGLEKRVSVASGQPSAFVLHLNPHAAIILARAERHLPPGPREFQRVVEQVDDG